MILGIPRETFPGERRVALVPDHAALLIKSGFQVRLEPGAGTEAGFPDADYFAKGVTPAADRAALFADCDLIAMVRTFGANPDAGRADLELLREGHILVGSAEPLTAHEQTQALAERKVSLFALELVPRITRAQSMDILSSMATVAGYKAVLLAAARLPKMFPMLMTAAGTVAPARVFVIGAGVAGLQAIASARRLGAVVRGYDVRPAVKEQVESLGAKFVELELEAGATEDKGGYAKALGEDFYRKQRELMTSVIKESDVVITTAAIPGKKAPILITKEMVSSMPPGSVLVDLAAERGGNCELTRPGEDVQVGGVTLMGPLNLAATVPFHASQMFAKNMATFLRHLFKDGRAQLDSEDEIIAGTRVLLQGRVTHPMVREAMGLEADKQADSGRGE